MLSSVFPSAYTIFSRYTRPQQQHDQLLERSIANLKSQDLEHLAHDITMGLRTIPVILDDPSSLVASVERTASSGLKVASESDNDAGGGCDVKNNEATQSSLEEGTLERPLSRSAFMDDGWTKSDENFNENEVESALADLDAAFAQCKASLETFDKKERFLGVRINRYRQLMERRARSICNLEDRLSCCIDQSIYSNSMGCLVEHEERMPLERENKKYESAMNFNGDLENKNDRNHWRKQLQSLQIKHEQDRMSLKSVEEIHKEMIVQIETLRRRIDDLEEKREDILEKREECREFLIVAAEHGMEMG